MYNVIICGSAGDGIETMSTILEKILKVSGLHVFTIRDAMSRVRGGQNFVKVRFGTKRITTHKDKVDVMFFMNEEAFTLHKEDLVEGGIAICDSSITCEDSRVIKLDLLENARELGNVKAFGTIGLGAILKLFGIDVQHASSVLSKLLKDSILEVNEKAIQAGYNKVEASYELNFIPMDDYIVINGNHALALGALAADLKFYSAYPMSPSTTILEYFETHGEALGLEVEQAEDEIAAINMALGAAYAGARAMTGTSGGGFSLMVEALGFSGMAELPLVAVDVQRPGPATGLPTRTEQSDLKFMISASQGEFPRMIIALKDQEDSFYQSARAVELAQKYRIPVILLSDQYIADTTATIPIPDVKNIYVGESVVADTTLEKSYAYSDSGVSPRRIPGESDYPVRVDSDEHDEFGVITESAEVRKQMMDKRMSKLTLLKKELMEPEFLGDAQFDTLFVGFGSLYGVMKEALDILNENATKKYGALIFGDVWPLPQKKICAYAKQAEQLINVEQNATGQLASIISEVTQITCDQSILKYDGRQLSVDDIIKAVADLKEGQ